MTALARRALDLAEREAGARGDDRVTAEHLLAGLARLDECVAVRTLGSLGVEIGGARTREAGGELGRVIERARCEAAELGHRYIGTEHLLLGVIREEGAEALGVSLHRARDQVVKVLHGRVV
ncbi:Clp protease N-terminal domain-containing protein [Planobispora longispora]|uniref:Clp protease N-terminal domain-containing protein n=1 Tax=Planobispora longispora TaxID=28887 RepID=UPI0019446407|nr:Clp protease N-terminal domain-containing protein [Planobispora longispora]